MKLVLASQSPRRRELLEREGLTFDVIPSGCEEIVPEGISPEMLVKELAILKARDVAAQIKDKDALIIGADTVVALDDQILGKPIDREDAKRMLRSLSNSTHRVFTGICVIRKSDATLFACSECTEIIFRQLTEQEIDEYVESGESDDKAGAYAVQAGGGHFVKSIVGDFDNVVGLPIKKLLEVLRDEFQYIQ